MMIRNFDYFTEFLVDMQVATMAEIGNMNIEYIVGLVLKWMVPLYLHGMLK